MDTCIVCGREIVEGQKKCQYCKSTTFDRVLRRTVDKSKNVIKETAKVSVQKSSQLRDFTVNEVQNLNEAVKEKSLERKKRKIEKLTNQIEKIEQETED